MIPPNSAVKNRSSIRNGISGITYSDTESATVATSVRLINFQPFNLAAAANSGTLIAVFVSHSGTPNCFFKMMATPEAPPVTSPMGS